MPYEIAVSSGFWGIPREAAPELLGLGMKISSVATYGVKYVQADIENPAEFVEPELLRQIKNAVDNLGIKWGTHGEIGTHLAFETAIDNYWRECHRRLHQYLNHFYDSFIRNNNEKYRPEYINFHASNMISIGFLVEKYRFVGLFTTDFHGNSDWTKLLEQPGNQELMKWFIEKLLQSVVFREYPNLAPLDEERREQLRGEPLYKIWKQITTNTTGKGTIRDEELAYALVARYMELKKDDPKEPVWKVFFGDKSLEDLERQWHRDLVDQTKGTINLNPDIVAAVGTRYILGHFQAKPLEEQNIEIRKSIEREHKSFDPFYEKTGFEKLSKVKVIFTFENPEIIEPAREGLQRIIHAHHIYSMVKTLQRANLTTANYFAMIFDSEHYIHNGLDPEKEIKDSPSDLGDIMFAYHIGAGKPYHPVHEPVDIGSEYQRIIYKYCYLLRQRGFGKKRRGLLIFERGGQAGAAPLQFMRSTVVSLRKISEQLDKNTNPENLPPEFYGVSPEGFLSPERQRTIIKEHARDPLKGMLEKPEEEYSALGKEAIETKRKSKEEWEKEKNR